jgi:Tfp pilus assembly protein PilO
VTIKLKGREKILIFFVIIAIAIWAFDRFYYTPQKKKIMNLKEDIKTADLKLQEALMFTQGVETTEAEVSRLEKELQEVTERTLKGEEFRTFLKNLGIESDRLQMKIVSLTFQEEKLSPPEGEQVTSAFKYKRVMVKMLLNSTYNSLGAYVKRIGELPFLVSVDNLQIERNEEIVPLLKVNMGLSVLIVS